MLLVPSPRNCLIDRTFPSRVYSRFSMQFTGVDLSGISRIDFQDRQLQMEEPLLPSIPSAFSPLSLSLFFSDFYLS